MAQPKGNYTPGPAPAVPRIRLKHRSKNCIYTTRSYMRIKKKKKGTVRKGAGSQEGPQRWLAARPRMFACNTGRKGRAALKLGAGHRPERRGPSGGLTFRNDSICFPDMPSTRSRSSTWWDGNDGKGPRGYHASPLPPPPSPFQGRPPWAITWLKGPWSSLQPTMSWAFFWPMRCRLRRSRAEPSFSRSSIFWRPWASSSGLICSSQQSSAFSSGSEASRDSSYEAGGGE